MAPFNGIPSTRQQIVLAIAPKCAATLSIIGSTYMILDCLGRSHRDTYHRLVVGMCVCDIMMSSGFFVSTWAMPVDTPNVWGAAGTVTTCEVVGFFEQAGLSTVLYNASLSVFYVLRIRLGWSSRNIARKTEIWLHGVPILIGLSTMCASLGLNLFNSGIFDCWIATFPQGCDESWNSSGDNACIRGDNASLYIWIFDLIPKWTAILLVTVNMWYTHRGVMLQERRSSQFSVMQSDGRPNIAKRLARQSYLYVGALYLTYIPVIVTRATELHRGYVYYEMLLTISIFIPLQGFWNAMVYLRPRILRNLEAQRHQRERDRTQRPTSNVTATSVVTSTLRAVVQSIRDGDLSAEEFDLEDAESGDDDDSNDDDDGKKTVHSSIGTPNGS